MGEAEGSESRRSFLARLFRVGVSTTLAGTLFGSDLFGMPRARAQGGASTVAIVTHPGLRAAEGDDRRRVYGAMLDKALSMLGGGGGRGALWQSYVPPGGGIGIKVNCLGGLGMSTDPQFAYAIAEGLVAGGADPTSIVVFDREDAHLENAGYPIVTEGNTIRVYGSNNGAAGWEDRVTRFGDAGDRLSRILTEQVKSIVNAPILKDHGLAGMTCALKNHFGIIQNPNKFHANQCEPFVSDLNTLRVIRRTQRICVADCRDVLYEGGPSDNANYHYQANSIMASTDPVALDAVGWQVIEGLRKQKGLPTLQDAGRPPRHIAAAANLDLGVADISSISVVNETIG